MAGNQIRVDTDAMQTAAGNFQTHASNLGDLIDNVTRVVSGLEGSWSSNASMSFSDFMTSWNKTASQVHEHLNVVHQNVKTGGQGYADTDQQIKSGFQI